jgi:hypothetical protein
MPDPARLQSTFDRLTEIYAPFRSQLIAKIDEPGNLYLETPPSTRYPNGFYFGAIKIGKRYVSFHLMPVYTDPDLLDGISVVLRRRMQGKSCFNFTHADDAILAELKQLTAAAFARNQREDLIPAS